MGVSINELLQVIKESGLPIGDKITKTRQQLAQEETLRSGVQGLYQSQLTEIDDEKKRKLETLANVDKQFSQIFGQGGKYQLKNPMAVEELTSGGQNLALNQFATTAEKQKNLLKEFESDVAKATSLYGKIDPSGTGSIADLEYISQNYGIELPNIDTGDSDWEIQNIDNSDWEISGEVKQPPIKGSDIIKENKA